ncbi:MAG: pirin family protein [Patescibacteria group bacterium]
MDKYFHDSRRRGYFDFGWLRTNHSFSFGSYKDEERMGFGTLRVLNDDKIQGGAGFDTHLHENMEIITIPLRGALEHKDSTGASGVIHPDEVQVMSAGSGIFHSESNHLPDEQTDIIQIWINSDKQNIQPRYDQKKFDTENNPNYFMTVVAGTAEDFSGPHKPLWINQNAYISLCNLEGGIELGYNVYDKSNGVFFFLIDGYVNVDGDNLSKRDSLEFTEIDRDTIFARSVEDSYLMVIEVPMK